MFFKSKHYVHGRRGFVNQIFQGLSLDKMVNKRFPEVLEQMIDLNFKSLITSFDKKRQGRDCLLKPFRIDLNELGESIASLLISRGLSSNSVISSERALINHLGINDLLYLD
jgi:hypothetical protein